MASSTSPKVSIVLALNPSTYHFSEPTAPELSLTVTSDSDKPFMVFTWNTVLWPKLALAQRQFIITDLTDNVEVTQTSIMLQRMPFSRVRGAPDEVYYLDILPDTPTTISTPFGRGNTQPQPKAVAQRGWEVDEEGNERESVHASGVDGLEPGHRYRLEVKREGLEGMWWRWGTKEDFLVDANSPEERRMWSADQSEKSPLDFEPIEGIEFSVEE